jgi:hypothetical protein
LHLILENVILFFISFGKASFLTGFLPGLVLPQNGIHQVPAREKKEMKRARAAQVNFPVQSAMMPRYAIERFPADEIKAYLSGIIK